VVSSKQRSARQPPAPLKPALPKNRSANAAPLRPEVASAEALAPYIQTGNRLLGTLTNAENILVKKKKPAEAGFFGAVEKTRTSTGCPTATSTLRVYQFRHDRIVVEPTCADEGACTKSTLGAQERHDRFLKLKIRPVVPI
jgi:hypothetical protein